MQLLALIVILSAATGAYALSDFQKMVQTERSFARLAAEKGTKNAFLAFAAKDGVLFLPDKINAIEYWKGRPESTGLLVWAPNYADISANGLMGYTTGNWEFRPKGKESAAEGF